MSWLFGTYTYEFVSYDPEKELLTLQKQLTPGIIDRLFGKDYETKIVQFIGSGTVWHSYPDFVRQSSFRELVFSAYLKRWRWEKEHGRSKRHS